MKRDYIHVFPVNDLKPHNTDKGSRCECNPVLKREQKSILVIHNSFDGREIIESLNDVLNP